MTMERRHPTRIVVRLALRLAAAWNQARVSAWGAAFALAFLCAGPAQADYQAGQRAWDEGRIGEALVQWQAAADAGDQRSMLALGRLYVRGLGVPQDYVEAHKWLNLAAARGDLDALKERDALAERMTPDERAEARKLARQWRQGDTAAPTDEEAAVMTRPPDANPPPRSAVREAQELLGELGYQPGPVDGLWGRRTDEAYRAFLRDARLPAAKVLTPEALRAMRGLAGRGTQTDSRDAPTGTAAGALPESDAVRPAAAPRDALHRAVQAGDAGAVKAALLAGAETNARDAQGWTALMHAANQGHALLIEPLLSAGAQPDARAPDGATALFIAALHGYSDIVAALLRAGADAAIPGPKGRTPLDMARSLNHSRILALTEVAAFEEAQARRERDAAERRRREEEKRRQEEESRAFERAKASDTLQAWAEFLSSWCPGGKLCATAGSRLDESVRASLAGKSFGGINSLGDEQRYEFFPSGKVDSVVRPSSWTRGWGSGTWDVEGGRIRIMIDWAGGVGRTISEAVLDGKVLAGRERYTREGAATFFGSKNADYTWRLTEHTAAEIEAERNAATRKRTFQSDGK